MNIQPTRYSNNRIFTDSQIHYINLLNVIKNQ